MHIAKKEKILLQLLRASITSIYRICVQSKKLSQLKSKCVLLFIQPQLRTIYPLHKTPELQEKLYSSHPLMPGDMLFWLVTNTPLFKRGKA